MRAARFLKVPPWELEEQPTFWRERALMAEHEEASAEVYLTQKAARAAKRGRGMH